MLKQISLIAIAIGIATVLISGTHDVNALLLRQQPAISAGHDQIFQCGGICASNGHGDSINLVPRQAIQPYS
jgi:hypothetical protein